MDINQEIKDMAEHLYPEMVKRRRDLHRHPEAGWTEFRTASMVIHELEALGYEVHFGKEVIDGSQQMGLPDKEVLASCMERAVEEGADENLVAAMAGGKTGVVGILHTGRPGKTVALRFDMDCNEVEEASDEKHRPYRERFFSLHPGCMHACGHDGHTTAGLAIAKIFSSLKDELVGTIKFIFQPAEEGVRGARAMVTKGIIDDADYLLGAHLMMPPVGFLGYDVRGFLATTKFDADFTGVPAHAGGMPECGKNALLAAANAAINIQGITRHSKGVTRINVGVLNAGTGRNVIPAHAHMEVETRGATTEVNDFVQKRAEEILKGAAMMYDVKVQFIQTGGAASGNNSPELSQRVKKTAERLGIFNRLEKVHDIGGSEDCSYFMERVQKHGGQAAYLVIGGSLAAVNHNNYFDFDERALVLEAQLLSTVVCELVKG
ncbi:amidohydrolase [Mitsuokella jalaludinii]|uniref:amidohydrolase n=1 Tax=Mitsuokella jalaludinii TaxID=187979 RepID=UPI003F9BC68C